ncbi:MAG: HTH domain-containing protein [Candidatus Aenigmarchaeota archaeon]|nr:HTH domain-containing protein [Candidatus Aenigmarchaeota archaeon]
MQQNATNCIKLHNPPGFFMAKRSVIRKRRKEVFRLIFDGKYHSQKEIAKILGVSRRTIVRDLKALENDIEREFNKRQRKREREFNKRQKEREKERRELEKKMKELFSFSLFH